MSINLYDRVTFESRHNGLIDDHFNEMLDQVGVESIEQLIDESIPPAIRKKDQLSLPKALNEFEYLNAIKQTASKNKNFQVIHRTRVLQLCSSNCDSKKYSGKPGLVHCIYSLSSRDSSRTLRGVDQFPDPGHGFDRNGTR